MRIYMNRKKEYSFSNPSLPKNYKTTAFSTMSP